MTIETPVALYLPVDGIDVGPGADLLAAAGITTIHLEMDAASKLSGDVAGRVVALMVGYEPVGADLFDRFPALRIVATHSAGVDMVDLDAARARGCGYPTSRPRPPRKLPRTRWRWPCRCCERYPASPAASGPGSGHPIPPQYPEGCPPSPAGSWGWAVSVASSPSWPHRCSVTSSGTTPLYRQTVGPQV